MLQLERVDNSRKISIRIRHKERFLNRFFLTAFAIATALHLLPLTLFTITPFRLGYTHRDLLPATVSADTASNDALVNTSAQESDPSTKYLTLIPHTESPSSKPRHLRVVKPEIQFTNDSLTSADPFEKAIGPIPVPSSVNLPISYPILSIEVSGPLAEEEIILNDTIKRAVEPRLIDRQNIVQHNVVYQVRYEGEKGTVFWFDPLQLSPNKKINALAERLLLSLRFQNDKKQQLLPGEIKITFTLNANEYKNLDSLNFL